MTKDSKIYIAGHMGLVGSAITRQLKSKGYKNLVYKVRSQLDLLNKIALEKFFEEDRPEYVFLAAAKVGGILANNEYPASFIYENLEVQNNVIHLSYKYKVKKLLFLGSSCIYPKQSKQPMKEEYLLSGPLEPTNEPYAIAKIAGIKMCQSYNRQYKTNFIACMPTNLYGFNDNFNPNTSHVLPALVKKFHDAKINNAKSVVLWGTGKPKREFLYVDDMADACILMMEKFNPTKEQNEKGEIFMNIGCGVDITILQLAKLVKSIVGFNGEIEYDLSKPDGTPRKLVDITKIKSLGWKPKVSLEKGIEKMYKWYINNG